VSRDNNRVALAKHEARFERHIAKEPGGCWNWTLKLRKGYGYFTVKKGWSIRAHRASYVLHRGNIRDGLVVDHICRNRRCVNPEHLRLVSHIENVMIGESLPARNRRKTACMHGHAFTAENTYVYSKGYRGCKTCRRASVRRHRETVTPDRLSTALNTVPFDLNAEHAALPVPEKKIDPR